jgi:SAM-dependent methyltransferase
VLRWTWNHPANRQRRLRSAARVITFQVRGRLGRRTLTTVGRRAQMWVALHETGGSKALYANPPDWNEMHAWRHILAPGDLFIDVGSNVGAYALWAADAGATVIAVEPSPIAAARLRENVALNQFQITVLQCGLSNEPGRMKLTRGRWIHWTMYWGSGSRRA